MPNAEMTLPDEFASTMQQLVAEAAQKANLPSAENGGRGLDQGSAGFRALEDRLAALERGMAIGFGKLATAIPQQLERVEESLLGLRSTESVNQRLFNSLHEELKEYRDNFLRDSLQKPFLRDLIVLFDDLSRLAARMQGDVASSEGKPAEVSQWCANLENAIHSVVEIMHRLEVSEIEPKETVDRQIHRVVSYEPAASAEEDERIVLRTKRGFIWRDQVLRPEEVVAKRFS